MKGISKRFVALMAALMLFVSAGMALAEAPEGLVLPDAQALLAGGGTIGFEASARFDATTLKGLLGMFMGSAEDDEATQTMVDAILGALNKLFVRGAYAKDALSGFLGTEEGELISLQAAYDEATLENTLTTNLLPDLAISLDPEMLRAAMGEMPQMSQAQAKAMLAPYGEAVMSFIQAQIGSLPQIALEPYDIQGIGLFHYRADFDITTRETAELMEQLYNIFKDDQNIQALLQQAEAAGGEESMGALDDMESGIKEIKAAEDEVILIGSVYMNEDGDTIYVVLDTPEDSDGRAHVNVLVKGSAVNVTMIIKGEDMFAQTGEETPAPIAEIDWDQVKADILSGANYMDTLVVLDTDVETKGNVLISTTRMNVILGGLNILVEADGSSRLDRLDTQAELRFYMGEENPLVTFTTRMYELDEHPQLPQLEGRTAVSVMVNDEGDLVPSDRIALQRSTEKLPGIFIEALNKALPAEGPALMTIFTSYLTLQEPETAAPEPVVVEETEPVAP